MLSTAPDLQRVQSNLDKLSERHRSLQQKPDKKHELVRLETGNSRKDRCSRTSALVLFTEWNQTVGYVSEDPSCPSVSPHVAGSSPQLHDLGSAEYYLE